MFFLLYLVKYFYLVFENYDRNSKINYDYLSNIKLKLKRLKRVYGFINFNRNVYGCI